MKRPHRRSHLLLWVILLPLVVVAGVYFWQLRPAVPTGELPEILSSSLPSTD